MNQVWLIAAHEFSTTVKRVGYVVVAFVLPLVMGSISGGAAWIAGRSQAAQMEAVYRLVGVVDLSGVLRGDGPSGLRRYPSEEDARRAVAAGTIRMFVVLPEDYLATGSALVEMTAEGGIFTSLEASEPPESLAAWVRRSLTADVALPADARARLAEPFGETTPVFLDRATGGVSAEDFRAKAIRIGVAIAFFMVLFFALMTSGGYLVQGLADEKENRVMEMVLCAVSAERLMAGKLIGLGAAGLLQMVIWMVMGGAGVVVFGVSVAIEPAYAGLCLVLFFFGYALYGSLLLATGSLGTNLREVSQWSAVWTMGNVIPMFFLQLLITEPNAPIARVLSYFPLTAASTTILRQAVEPLPAWELGLVLAILIGSTLVALKAAAKVYRVGLLLYGQRPTPRMVWRWLRA